MNWTPILNRVVKVIDEGPAYLTGGQFIRMMQDVDPYLSGYTDFIQERSRAHKSTTRRDFFKHVLRDFPEQQRFQAVLILLDHVEPHDPNVTIEIRSLLGGQAPVPCVSIPVDLWNASRLMENLRLIDAATSGGEYERAITLSYSCMEGFMGAFVRAKYTRDVYPNEIGELAKEVKNYLKDTIQDYPDEVLNLVRPIANAIDRARNQFSESHFGKEAGLWLATYVRDLLNTQIRLLLHFM
jgi:hypothetical protein